MKRTAGHRLWRLPTLILLLLLLPLVACRGSYSAGDEVTVEGNATVEIDNFAFKPARLRVARGATVTWRNRDSLPHDAVPKRGPRWTPFLEQGQAAMYTFTEPGSFPYICSIHPYMQGAITVMD